MAPSIDDLAALHLEALYRYDAAGGIPRIDAQHAAPRFHLFRTATGNHWRFGAGCSAAIRVMLEAALAREPLVVDCAELERQPPALDALRALLAQQALPTNDYCGPAFRFPDAIPRQPSAATIAAVADAS
ncbi:MAG: hypothetical protein O3B31_14400, partial [Chloroflexi bacterium]|nr:hypothetical protein [Chloroflexota bacterium]